MTGKLPKSKLPVRLVALDLDDTLLRDDLSISEETSCVLCKCCERGIYVVLCSGRSKKSVLPFVEQLGIAQNPFGRYLIAMNGCSVYDTRGGREIFTKLIASDVLVRANEEAERLGLRGQVYADDKIYFAEETHWTRQDGNLCGLENVVVPNFEAFMRQGTFYKMLVAGEESAIALLQRRLSSIFCDKAVVVTSKPYFLEVLPAGSGKGEAIEHLVHFLAIPQDSTLGFGDSMNDQSMIKKCGFGVAMVNGDERIKQIADFVTERSNDQDGVAHFIETYIL